MNEVAKADAGKQYGDILGLEITAREMEGEEALKDAGD